MSLISIPRGLIWQTEIVWKLFERTFTLRVGFCNRSPDLNSLTGYLNDFSKTHFICMYSDYMASLKIFYSLPTVIATCRYLWFTTELEGILSWVLLFLMMLTAFALELAECNIHLTLGHHAQLSTKLFWNERLRYPYIHDATNELP